MWRDNEPERYMSHRQRQHTEVLQLQQAFELQTEVLLMLSIIIIMEIIGLQYIVTLLIWRLGADTFLSQGVFVEDFVSYVLSTAPFSFIIIFVCRVGFLSYDAAKCLVVYVDRSRANLQDFMSMLYVSSYLTALLFFYHCVLALVMWNYDSQRREQFHKDISKDGKNKVDYGMLFQELVHINEGKHVIYTKLLKGAPIKCCVEGAGAGAAVECAAVLQHGDTGGESTSPPDLPIKGRLDIRCLQEQHQQLARRLYDSMLACVLTTVFCYFIYWVHLRRRLGESDEEGEHVCSALQSDYFQVLKPQKVQ